MAFRSKWENASNILLLVLLGHEGPVRRNPLFLCHSVIVTSTHLCTPPPFLYEMHMFQSAYGLLYQLLLFILALGALIHPCAIPLWHDNHPSPVSLVPTTAKLTSLFIKPHHSLKPVHLQLTLDSHIIGLLVLPLAILEDAFFLPRWTQHCKNRNFSCRHWAFSLTLM